MDTIQIIGGNRLKGKIKISGSKNSALPILAATLLTNVNIKLNNVPNLSDVSSMINLLESLNVIVCKKKKNSYELKATQPKSLYASYELVRKMRASFLILGPLLTKYGSAKVSLPGGCAIGTRPVDIHLENLQKMGAEFSIKDGYVEGKLKKKFSGATINFRKKSVGATENIIMAATLAEGRTIINNAAMEPEITDLCDFLVKIGAKIKGQGTEKIEIIGVDELAGCSYSIMPDRIEAGTFALCVLGCGGQVTLTNINEEIFSHLKNILKPIKPLEIKKMNENEILVKRNKNNSLNLKIMTQEYPGFPTDLQAQLTSALLKINGVSEINERIFENRFMHISELQRMGANVKKKGSKVKIIGVNKIYGAELMATDLRASSSLIIAGLMAEGKTIINRVYHLDRGYENIEKKLRYCGAKIIRVKK